MSKRRVFLRTLGCPKNEVDGSVLQRHLEQAGCVIVDDPSEADVEIINTCGFIEATKLESLEAIWEAVDRKAQSGDPDKKLIVTGCLAQRYSTQLAEEIGDIDSIVGFDRPDLVLKAIDASRTGAPACWVEKPGATYRDDQIVYQLSGSTPAPLSAYMKIADGCDNACRFCAIPLIRGKMRSRTAESIVAETCALVAGGTKEVILVAQDTTSWGVDFGNDSNLADLLHKLNQIDGSFWIRLMYAHPAFLSDQQIEAIAVCEKVVPYVDMPLQHISDRMLTLMNRHTTRAQIQQRIDRLRAARSDMALRTTFIVGHPGETDDDFAELLEFAEANAIERMGAFKYSPEEGTPSARMEETVDEDTVQDRVNRLTEAYDRWSADQSVDQIGQIKPCLIARSVDGEWEGRTIHDAPEIDGRVTLTGPVLAPGIHDVLLTDAFGVDFSGRLLTDADRECARVRTVSGDKR